MKLYQYISCLLLMMYSPLIIAQPIRDINQDDPNYTVIEKAVTNGYLSLYNDQTFKPNTSLSRRDAAIIIHELEKKLKAKSSPLASQDLQELNSLSNSFKQIFNTTNNSLLSIQNDNKMLRHEQKLLLHEITDLQAANNRYKKERKLLFGLIAFSTLLGSLYP
ncbi:hypothetical protein DID74_01685 [Candidatus Marinamargulisbacteria bacterium SCGC AG-333-B06]|nr:hypothetical protein DID74_01685 [Candidatus Marinamargulisbacteria bacterium SCGC AG-333-B06]